MLKEKEIWHATQSEVRFKIATKLWNTIKILNAFQMQIIFKHACSALFNRAQHPSSCLESHYKM